MYFIGIDIGSTAAKTAVIKEGQEPRCFVLPTGWSSRETAETIRRRLAEEEIPVETEETKVLATGYGRISVPYADRCITEITCHGRGGAYLSGSGDCTIIDVGGQDTKVITLEDGVVTDFLMNDKCSAGTGKFLEIMANRLGSHISGLFELAEGGKPLAISAMCTVFAESEVISHIGSGAPREDIAAGVVDSVAAKVAQLCMRHGGDGPCVLTGGLSEQAYFADTLSGKLGRPVRGLKDGKYAGAIGAALLCMDMR